MASQQLSVQELNDWRQIAFAAALVERMASNYMLFSELTEFGDGQLYRNILNLVWESVSGQNAAIDFYKQLEKLQPIVPDPVDFDMYGVMPALDACVALEQLLNLCLSTEVSEIESLLQLSDSTIENYLVAIEADSDDVHPLLQRQQEFCAQLLVRLSDLNGSRSACIKSLKQWLREDQSSNIGISLE